MLFVFMKLSILLVLTVMSIQDFKYRAISWYAFPVLAVFLAIVNPAFSLADSLVNIGFVLLNYLLATLLLSLKYKRAVNLLEAHIGLGDLLMLICIAFYFPVIAFFLFYLSSLVLVALGAGIYIIWRKPRYYTVPLAGLQSALLLLLVSVAWLTGWSVSDTSWFENYLL